MINIIIIHDDDYPMLLGFADLAPNKGDSDIRDAWDDYQATGPESDDEFLDFLVINNVALTTVNDVNGDCVLRG